jgi:RNA polymerase-binding transcription factor DksA
LDCECELIATAPTAERFRLSAGTCDRCGQPIDPERLEAIPGALLCLGCQVVTEREANSGALDIDWGRLDESLTVDD